MQYADVVKIAAQTGACINTVRKWASGGRVTTANRRLLEAAAKKLGIQVEAKEEAQSG